MRIKFLANGILDDFDPTGSGTDGIMVINPAYWMMKHYHTLHGRHQPEWLLQNFLANKTSQEQVDELIQDGVDLLLLPCFVWNQKRQMEVARLFKEQTKDKHVVVGGPNLTAHKDSKFFKTHPYIDYAVYGDGEKALSNIIDYLHDGHRDNWINTVENVGGRRRLWPYETLRDEEYWSTSPYLTQKQFIVDNINNLYKETGLKQNQVMLSVEFARGCMYKCVYCDWSQNLTKKVVRRKAEWQLELDFFCELNIMMRESDANFGQWKQDLEIYEYAVKLHKPNRNFKFLVRNTAKLDKNKDRFLVPQVETYNVPVVLSFEDTEPEQLAAMNRPGLKWEEQQIIIANIRDRLGEDRFTKYVSAELMLGTPTQTIATYKENFKKLLAEGITSVWLNQWVLVPNSPGADPVYQNKYGVKWMDKVLEPKKQLHNPKTVREAYDLVNNTNFAKGPYVWSTNDMTHEDIVAILIAGRLFRTEIIENKVKKRIKKEWSNNRTPDMTDIVENVFAKAQSMAKEKLKIHKPLIEEYGFVFPLDENMNFSFFW